VQITYAVGDVHGQLQKLLSLLALCEEHGKGRTTRLVFLGDYIDRGPESRATVETLIGLQQKAPGRITCLRGNHEAVVVDIARHAKFELDPWLRSGGGATTHRSYGVDHPSALPQPHLDWMASLPLSYDDGRRYFAHAGVNPSLPLAEQCEEDLLWIREPFLSSDLDFGRLVVHGHTPVMTRTPDLRSNRLNLDTAAGYGGPVTAAVFEEGSTTPIGFLNAM
jgi:serine/threonine protein phosphatase 1